MKNQLLAALIFVTILLTGFGYAAEEKSDGHKELENRKRKSRSIEVDSTDKETIDRIIKSNKSAKSNKLTKTAEITIM